MPIVLVVFLAIGLVLALEGLPEHGLALCVALLVMLLADWVGRKLRGRR